MDLKRLHLLFGTAIVLLASVSMAAPAAAQQETPVATAAEDTDELAEGFRSPPQAARPQVWWHWMSGNVTEEGAKLDLEWMERIGVGGVHAFSGELLEPSVVLKPLPFMSDGWREAYRASVKQARAAGMDVTIAGSPGWSQTGGPWVPPPQGMKKYTWTVTEVEGGRPVRIVLPRPATATGPFLGLAPERGMFAVEAPTPQADGLGPVIAFPTPRAVMLASASYRTDTGPLAGLADAPADLSRTVSLPLPESGDLHVDIDLGVPLTVRALTIAVDPLTGLEVLASDDGSTFRSVRRLAKDSAEKPSAQQTIALPPTLARFLRIRFDRPQSRILPGMPPAIAAMMAGRPAPPLKIKLLRAETAPRVDRFEAKAGFQSTVMPDASDLSELPGPAIAPGSVIDLTAKVRPDGTVDWTPPAGKWTIVRFGWSLTGHTNGPAEASATGLEVDKLDAGAVRDYAEALFSLYRDKGGNPLGRDGIDGLLTDSWEAGVQNWTPAILDDFRRLRGYDPLPWLPVLAGQIVGSARRSDAFLFDYRQTLKDLLVTNHYGVLADAAHRNGMTYYTEAQGDTPRAIGDGLAAKARSDIPTGEFWYRPFATAPGQPSLIADLKEAASAAHLYGKPLVAAEAMTVAAGVDPWAFSPGILKPVADEIFAHGVNRMLVHESHLQPFVDRKPGLTLGFFGQFFNRNDTWAERAKPWVDYLARTSWMLQQGRFVADIAYFYGEEENLSQRFEHRGETDVPTGYGYDYVNAEALLGKLSVRDGRIVTDSGMAYRVLYLPADVTRMTLPVIEKLGSLLRAGAVVVARKPQGGLGLASDDAEVRAAAQELWGGAASDRRSVGQGRLYGAGTLEQALLAEGLVADVAAPPTASLLTLHRRTADAEIYFVSNRSDQTSSVPVSFRTAGRAAEWWSADTGEMRPLTYLPDGEVTRVELPLSARAAGFVVFRRPGLAGGSVVAPLRETSARTIEGRWQVRFEPNRGAPATATFQRLTDWSANDDPDIRYFSGAATYSREIAVSKSDLAASRLVLDLGDVREIATISVNGKEVGTVWHAPFRVDMTGKLRLGTNRLEVEVINLWPNRLIGDKQPGATPIGFAPQSPYRAESPLLPSGLIGPVRLVTLENGGR